MTKVLSVYSAHSQANLVKQENLDLAGLIAHLLIKKMEQIIKFAL